MPVVVGRVGWLLTILDSEKIYLQLYRLTTESTSMDYGSREQINALKRKFFLVAVHCSDRYAQEG